MEDTGLDKVLPIGMETNDSYILSVREINDIKSKETGQAPKAYLRTFGCQQNESDSEKVLGMLDLMGYEITDDIESADVILYNTCAVRENAENRVFGILGPLKGLKEKKPDLLIGIFGCMAQEEGVSDIIKQKYRHVNMVFGTHALHKFPQILYRAITEEKIVIDTSDKETEIVEGIPTLRTGGAKAWVSIMYGCNNFCSYCIVPYVRGRERSRNREDILNEVKSLKAEGIKEITLLGQNVNSYGKDKYPDYGFAELLEDVAKTKIPRIRFMTSHPKDISDKLLEVMSKYPNIAKHLHLPAQSGSNKVLESMNRKYTRERYLEIVNKARKLMPQLAFSTDIIVGFPTETNEDFEDTIKLLKEVEYDMIFSFIYSKRKGTPAAKMESALTHDEIMQNFNRMLEVQSEIALRKNQEMVGKVYEVLVEGESKNNKDLLTGRTDSNKIVHFEGDKSLVGNFVNIKIIKAQTYFLFGEIIN